MAYKMPHNSARDYSARVAATARRSNRIREQLLSWTGSESSWPAVAQPGYEGSVCPFVSRPKGRTSSPKANAMEVSATGVPIVWK